MEVLKAILPLLILGAIAVNVIKLLKHKAEEGRVEENSTREGRYWTTYLDGACAYCGG